MKPTCSTCRYWDHPDGEGSALCHKLPVRNVEAHCEFEGTVFTGSKFGCVHWESSYQPVEKVHQGFVPMQKDEWEKFWEWMANHKQEADEKWWDQNSALGEEPPQWLVERWRRAQEQQK